MDASSYFNFADSDIVLRTSSPETVDFAVHRCILSSASPFFEEMFTLPQGSSTDAHYPIIDVSETPTTLDTLLRLVYPVPDPTIDDLDNLTSVLTAATKYELSSVVENLRKLLIAPRFVEKYPTRVYAIASRFELEEEVKVASRYTLSVNILDCPLHDDLKHITAYAYHQLLNLHHQRAQAAQALLQCSEDVKCMQCNGTRYGCSFGPPRWWRDFEERAKEELRMRPTTDVIFSMAFLAKSAQAGCERCAGSPRVMGRDK
ncbi:uncharacterized protein LAESUDRAFT_736864 [Laetiporus sulphureus 93-53]|uniref:BTB domain-containing protein n=1 Tax=Laetiporus sulphureus 93-53 TaxID=1314785 RepID=A0A165E8A0_9APHY|nr:uncharacterized protein LAESUDRAFT_736864 [Laetiporus sulphureus 93-53]KZT06441.1 hypothetical protein LAESUDRAFT_736864 [Laetiporus sulphureus 93-53]